jgi:predicted DsbA family dithiol-disulfide isomerase
MRFAPALRAALLVVLPTPRRSLGAAVGFALLAGACRGGAAETVSQSGGDIEMADVDTREFTAREKHEFSGYMREFPAPCPAVAVPLAQCVLEKRSCRSCLPAAMAVAKAVREGMTPEQVRRIYKERFDPTSKRVIPTGESPSRGPDTAPVTIVEFADFECPFCQHIAPELDGLWEKRKAVVRFVFKFMPLSIHPHSELAARAAIAAQKQGKFWEMHRQLFASGTRLDQSDLEGYAKAIGLEMDRFRADMQSPATKAHLDADRKAADDLGVKATPTLFINGREYDPKLQMDGWIDDEIAASGSSRAGASP